jgi:predicted MPP superfamily phosphohydrolase
MARMKLLITYRFWIYGTLLGLAGWSTLIEPHWLETTYTTIKTSKIRLPVRIVVVADIQTTQLGNYEKRVLRKAVAMKPDIILFTGDYLQADKDYGIKAKEFNDYLNKIRLKAILGVYAVAGNNESSDWRELFKGLGVKGDSGIRNYKAGEITITTGDAVGWSTPQINRTAVGGYRIVLAHFPDIALTNVKADLIVAGHTHGGQVRLPFIGPVFNHSKIPLRWTSGLNTLPNGNLLYVSRGIGMERGWAPRIRFNCRPELAVIDLVPLRQ